MLARAVCRDSPIRIEASERRDAGAAVPRANPKEPIIARHLTRLLVIAIIVLTVTAAGCGSSTSSSSSSGGAASSQSQGGKTQFAKTKFVIHAGLAFGAFHRYIYKPFRNGGFSPPSRHKLALVKGAAAALFAYHESKIALHDAQSSPLLRKLVSPITALQTRLQALGARLKGGQAPAGDITSANSQISRISNQSSKAGQPISDQPTPSLGG